MNDQNGLSIVFAGTPEFAAVHLQALLTQNRHKIAAVYTQPDRPAGRGKKLHASPVKQLALGANLTIEQPRTLKDVDAQARLAAYKPDIMVVVAYGLLLPQSVLQIPRLGCINVHASILPRWRGAAPIQRAIEAGDNETGITIMQMDVGLDTGDMLNKVTCPIHATDTATQLHNRLADMGPAALLNTLDQLASGTARGQPQCDELATYAHKLVKDEGLLDWQLSAEVLDRKIRAFNPFPVAFVPFRGDRLRILAAKPVEAGTAAPPGTITSVSKDQLIVACGEQSALAIEKIQLPGKKAISARDALNGTAELLCPGTRLADS